MPKKRATTASVEDDKQPERKRRLEQHSYGHIRLHDHHNALHFKHCSKCKLQDFVHHVENCDSIHNNKVRIILEQKLQNELQQASFPTPTKGVEVVYARPKLTGNSCSKAGTGFEELEFTFMYFMYFVFCIMYFL